MVGLEDWDGAFGVDLKELVGLELPFGVVENEFDVEAADDGGEEGFLGEGAADKDVKGQGLWHSCEYVSF